MLYVVVIELERGEKDYKVFSKSDDGIRRHDTALRAQNLREPVSVGDLELLDKENGAFLLRPGPS